MYMLSLQHRLCRVDLESVRFRTLLQFYDADDLCVIGTRGREKGEFTNLQGISTCSGRVVVADSNNQCIQVWPIYHNLKCVFCLGKLLE